MSGAAGGYSGQSRPQDGSSDFASTQFLIKMMMGQMSTAQLVIVKAITNAGDLSPVGFVDVQPLVNQIDGAGVAVPHGTIHHLPYFRLQGGANAVILDPQVGDIGICVVASRDISSVKVSKAQANPSTRRRFDLADGLYIGGLLNGTPTQYVQFTSSGINIVSPLKVTITAPNVEVDASTEFTVNSPIIALNGNITQTAGSGSGTVTMVGPVNVVNDVTAGTISLENHVHTDPQGGNTGKPVP